MDDVCRNNKDSNAIETNKLKGFDLVNLTRVCWNFGALLLGKFGTKKCGFYAEY